MNNELRIFFHCSTLYSSHTKNAFNGVKYHGTFRQSPLETSIKGGSSSFAGRIAKSQYLLSTSVILSRLSPSNEGAKVSGEAQWHIFHLIYAIRAAAAVAVRPAQEHTHRKISLPTSPQKYPTAPSVHHHPPQTTWHESSFSETNTRTTLLKYS